MKSVCVLTAVVLSLISKVSAAQTPLAFGFDHPQDSARTKVWWFHGETIGTHEGITADLEAFKDKGVGGVVYYDQVHGDGEGAFKVFSPAWWDELIFSSQEAKRLGLSFEANCGNGYVAGGKWITPDKSMQSLACTETVVEGGKDIDILLPLPERMPGGWHHDVAVMAVPYTDALLAEVPMTRLSIASDKPFVARSITYEVTAQGKARTSSMQVPPSHFEFPTRPGSFFGCGFKELPPVAELQASDDGRLYRKVCDLRPRYRNLGGIKQQTVSFPAVSAPYFRIVPKDSTVTFSHVRLSARASIDVWQEKASLISEFISADHTPAYAPAELADFSHAIDLTAKLGADGTLRWQHAPKGKWLVLRFLSVSNGGHTKHGRKEALGLECDKLSVDGARQQWQSYVKPVIDSIRAHGGAIQGICMDSHEAGPQNWTVGFEEAFRQLRGYDMRAYLPVMAGYVVESVERSDKFLYDLRRTISDLITDRYFGEFNRLCQAEGLTLTAQAIGGALCMAGDAIEVKKLVDKPQAEFWGYQTEGNYDIKDCSSAAHLYGKLIASGEAFTDVTYRHTLADIKNLADYAWCFGINELVVCAVAYQPWLDNRLNTANGRQYVLNRKNTLWPMSRPFWDYQARCSWMMRQGKPVADACIYLGDDVPMRTLSHRLPDLPQGYDFDAFTTDALLHRMSAKDGRISLPDGISYRLMILPPEGPMTDQAQQQIEAFRQQGVAIYNPQTDKRSLETFLRDAGIQPDVEAPGAKHLYFAHRRTVDEDIYFLNNHSDDCITNSFVFNTDAAGAELWDPVTGVRRPLSIQSLLGRTAIRLEMAPRESYFVIFGHQDRQVSPSPERTTVTNLMRSPWQVTFDAKMGGPSEAITFDQLTDWTKHDDARIKYYAGTAIYRNTFKLKQKVPHASYCLETGKLSGAAEVLINGQTAGIIWCSPWRFDITTLLHKGDNQIELRVANCLWNRLVGDARLAESERIIHQTHPLAKPADALLPAGLIGDVRISVSTPKM